MGSNRSSPEYMRKWRSSNPDKCKGYQSKFRGRRPELRLLSSSRSRAKKQGLQFNIDVSDVPIPDVCPVLGIRLHKAVGRLSDHSPSVDRVDTELGYVKGNVVVMSMRANRIKSNGTAEEHELIAQFIRNFSEQTK